MKTCGTCLYWKRAYGSGHPENHGRCSNEKFVYDEPCPKDGLRWGYECYSAGFETGEDFGCVHWAAIPEIKA